MSTNHVGIRQAIVAWCSSQGINAVWANQSAPRPPRPFALVNFIMTNKAKGHDELRLTDIPGEQEWHGLREMTLQIMVIASVHDEGTSIHLEWADKLAHSLNLESVRDTLFLSKLSVVEVLPVTDVTTFLENKHEPKAVFDVRLYTTALTSENLTYIEKVVVNGETVP